MSHIHRLIRRRTLAQLSNRSLISYNMRIASYFAFHVKWRHDKHIQNLRWLHLTFWRIPLSYVCIRTRYVLLRTHSDKKGGLSAGKRALKKLKKDKSRRLSFGLNRKKYHIRINWSGHAVTSFSYIFRERLRNSSMTNGRNIPFLLRAISCLALLFYLGQ